MPISATGNSTDRVTPRPGRPPASNVRGFSLLELLVVVTIIGIFTGIVVLSVGVVGNDRSEQREARRLKSLLGLIHDQAVLQSRDYGVLFSPTGYRFYVYSYRQMQWVSPSDDRLLAPHALESPVKLSLRMGSQTVSFQPVSARTTGSGKQSAPDSVDPPHPQVVILSSGRMTPFQVSFQRDFARGQVTVSAAVNGNLTISEHGYNSTS